MLGFRYKYLPSTALATIPSEADGVCRVLRLHRETDGKDAERRSLLPWGERIKKQHAVLLMLLYILYFQSSNVEVRQRDIERAPYPATAPEGPQCVMPFSPMGTMNLIA